MCCTMAMSATGSNVVTECGSEGMDKLVYT